jgi:phosphoserine/homoserine phosphotransferase
MNVLCLDLEGVLIPEVWQAVAASTGVDGLQKTTRDIPVYDDLMSFRLRLLDQNRITLSQIQKDIEKMDPLPGAIDFLAWAKERFQLAIISDTFYEFAMPLIAKLGSPMLLCHHLLLDGDKIVGYRLRQSDPKRRSVRAFKSLDLRVVAAGDSFNDVSMLQEADAGFFFKAPKAVIDQYPDYELADNYEDLKTLIETWRISQVS